MPKRQPRGHRAGITAELYPQQQRQIGKSDVEKKGKL
jgi:hypothetical protein